MKNKAKRAAPRIKNTVGGPAWIKLVPQIGPGWYGMVPALFTENRNLLVFLPQELYAGLIQTKDVELHVTTQGADAALVSKLYHKV